jgi:hypothetical protein
MKNRGYEFDISHTKIIVLHNGARYKTLKIDVNIQYMTIINVIIC